MINTYFQFDLTVLGDLIKGKKTRIVRALTRKMNALSVELASKIVAEKLHGQVLKQRTGVLAGSVHPVPTRVVGTELLGEVRAAEGPAWYGEVHEFGGTRRYPIEPVNKKALMFMMRGKKVFSMHVNHPAAKVRSFMRSTMDENANYIAESLTRAVVEELE